MTAPSKTVRHRRERCFPRDRLSTGLLVSGGVTAVTLITAFGLLAVDVEYFWVVFIVGFGGILPTALGFVVSGWPMTGSDHNNTPANDPRTPLEELRLQYARGELTEAEFERRVERFIDDDITNQSSYSTR